MQAYEKENGFKPIEIVIETRDEFTALREIMEQLDRRSDKNIHLQKVADNFLGATEFMDR